MLQVSSLQLSELLHHLVPLPDISSFLQSLSPLTSLPSGELFILGNWPIQMSGGDSVVMHSSDDPLLRSMTELMTCCGVIVCLCIHLSSLGDALDTCAGEEHVVQVAFI